MIPASDEQIETLARQAREKIGASATHHTFAPRDAERIVFEVVGENESATRTWQKARSIGEDAKKHAKAALHRQYGGRAPNGWIGWLLILAAVSAALSAALSSGFRAAPEDREVFAAALAIGAGAIDLAVLVALRFRPLDRAKWRIQAVVALGLILSAVFTFTREAVGVGAVIAAAAGIAVVLLVSMFAVRAAQPDAAADIDGSTARAFLAAIDGARSDAVALQARVASDLGPDTARLIVQVRTRAFASARTAGGARVDLSRFDDSVPAGGVIIGDFADPMTWLPKHLAEKA